MLLERGVRVAGLLGIVVIYLGPLGCASPARPTEMKAVEYESDKTYDASLSVTVYGDVGGFASHYYPLPREDFEQALLQTLSNSGVFRSVSSGGDADFRLSVGMMQLVQPQWSGNVTLETTWAVTSTSVSLELARKSISSISPASFSQKREATEAAAQKNISDGITWLLAIIESATSEIQ